MWGIFISAVAGVIALVFILKWAIKRWIESYVSTYQSELLNRHYEEVENIYKQMRGWKHDYHNHIQLMMAYIEMNRVDEMSAHLAQLLEDIVTVDHVIKTGNVMVDAILNSKVSLMMASNIEVNAKATVPEKHSISDVDLCAIIGNVLDNALEAAQKVPENERFVRIYIRPMKGQLYISVSNASAVKPQKGFLTTKAEGGHGFGIRRIDQLVSKYGGYVNRQAEEGVFACEISLPFARMTSRQLTDDLSS